jgi:prepilin-type N-terminal cleavage/methylation domain-containing protein
MFKKNRQGFTLIELMVVIVIIGVLAALAIPRFGEASARARSAEAPRVLASYESAYLAAVAELPSNLLTNGRIEAQYLIFEAPTDSRWWNYATQTNVTAMTATADATMGSIPASSTLVTVYNPSDDCFHHDSGNIVASVMNRMFPNFINTCAFTGAAPE